MKNNKLIGIIAGAIMLSSLLFFCLPAKAETCGLSSTSLSNDPNLVSNWTFNDTHADLLNNNNFTFNGGIFNNAFGVPGWNTAGWLSTPEPAFHRVYSLNGTAYDGNNYVIGGWVRFNDTNGCPSGSHCQLFEMEHQILSCYYSCSWKTARFTRLSLVNNSTLLLERGGNRSGYFTNASFTIIPDTNWHFVVINAVGQNIYLYWDGVKLGSVYDSLVDYYQQPSEGTGGNESFLTIGSTNTNDYGTANSSYSDWFFFNRTLSPAEIATIHTADRCVGYPAPTLPNLGQFKLDGTTPVADGATTAENGIIFQGTPTSPIGEQVQLQVEIQLSNVPFTGFPTVNSTFASSGTTASIPLNGLSNNHYHWAARAVDSQGNRSNWTRFGNGELTISDPGQSTCGLTGTSLANDPNLVSNWTFNFIKTDLLNNNNFTSGSGLTSNSGSSYTTASGVNGWSTEGWLNSPAFHKVFPLNGTASDGNNYVISGWVRFNDTDGCPSGSHCQILEMEHQTYGCYYQCWWSTARLTRLSLTNTSTLFLERGGNQSGYFTNASFPITLDTNWHFVSINAVGQHIHLYWDGVNLGSVYDSLIDYYQQPSTQTGNNESFLTLGSPHTGDYGPANASYSDWSFFNRALSSEEIGTVYAAGQCGVSGVPATPPTLAFTDLPGYADDSSDNGKGVEPNKGVANLDDFVFKTIYTDAANSTLSNIYVSVRNTVNFKYENYKEQLGLDNNANIVPGSDISDLFPVTTKYVGSGGSIGGAITEGESVIAELTRSNIYQATTTAMVYSALGGANLSADILLEALDSSGVVIGSNELNVSLDENVLRFKRVSIAVNADSPIHSMRVTAKHTNDVGLWLENFELEERIPLVIDTEAASSTLKDGDYSNGEEFTAVSKFSKGSYTYSFVAINPAGSVRFPESGELSFTAGYSNVVFLPGIEGSRLYKQGLIFENQLWEPNGNADVEKLFMSSSTGQSLDPTIYTRDIIDEANFIPDPTGTLQPNIYKSFINFMNDEVVGKGVINNWAAIPYDWRLDFDDLLAGGIKNEYGNISYLNGTDTQYIIQEIRHLAETSDTGKVTIVAHSMGGLVAKKLSLKLGNDASKLFDQMIFVAVPQVGTPQAVGALLHGFEQGLPLSWFDIFLTPSVAREMGKDTPSAYTLLPSSQYFTQVNDPVITFSDEPLLENWRTKYGAQIDTADGLNYFLTDATRDEMPVTKETYNPLIANSRLLNNATTTHDSIDNWVAPAGVRLTEIAGWGMDTLKTIAYHQGSASVCAEWTGYGNCLRYFIQPTLEYSPETVVDGDGTVVVPSALWSADARVTKYWLDLFGYNHDRPSSFTHFDDKHANIFEVPELRIFIKNIIIGDNTLPKFITATDPVTNVSGSRLHFVLHSPLTLDLYDDQGNHTGISTTTGYLEEDIPGSQYLTFGEVKYISVPASTSLHLSMHGYETGSFTLEVQQVDGNTTIASTTFAAIPSVTSTVATMDFPANSGITGSSPLLVDENGDGNTDWAFVPKPGGIVLPVFDNTPPTTTISLAGTDGTNGWYTSNVEISFVSTDTESGVANTFYSLNNGQTFTTTTESITISTEWTTAILYYSVDNAGNKEETKSANIKIDKTAPVIVVPTMPSSTILGTPISFNFSASDNGLSGVSTTSASIDGNPVINGTVLANISTGNHIFQVTSIDNAGNTAVEQITFAVVNNFSGFLSPIKTDGSGIYNLGRTLPIKFNLTNASGTLITSAIAHLVITNVQNGIIGTVPVNLGTSANDSGTLFRISDNQYIYNLDTKLLTSGTWQISAVLDDGKSYSVLVSLR